MSNSNITLELLRVYESFADQINISADISNVLHGIRDIKASGNEIEAALRNVFIDLLPKKYAIGHGHIIDNTLQVSKQYDFIVSDNVEFKSILKTKDATEIYLYETIYAIAEVKATWNRKNLEQTIESIRDLKERLSRNNISSKTILSGNAEIQLQTDVTNNPARNPLFSFAFAIKEDKDFSKLKTHYSRFENWPYLPNITVILNRGIFVMVHRKELQAGKLLIQLYPQYCKHEADYEWRFITCTPGKSLAYLLFCLTEHLSISILEKPSYLNYASSILNIADEDLLHLNEL